MFSAVVIHRRAEVATMDLVEWCFAALAVTGFSGLIVVMVGCGPLIEPTRAGVT